MLNNTATFSTSKPHSWLHMTQSSPIELDMRHSSRKSLVESTVLAMSLADRPELADHDIGFITGCFVKSLWTDDHVLVHSLAHVDITLLVEVFGDDFVCSFFAEVHKPNSDCNSLVEVRCVRVVATAGADDSAFLSFDEVNGLSIESRKSVSDPPSCAGDVSLLSTSPLARDVGGKALDLMLRLSDGSGSWASSEATFHAGRGLGLGLGCLEFFAPSISLAIALVALGCLEAFLNRMIGRGCWEDSDPSRAMGCRSGRGDELCNTTFAWFVSTSCSAGEVSECCGLIVGTEDNISYALPSSSAVAERLRVGNRICLRALILANPDSGPSVGVGVGKRDGVTLVGRSSAVCSSGGYSTHRSVFEVIKPSPQGTALSYHRISTSSGIV
ncbi:hypothetical protein KCU61_g500, partial [Aureobasidium melanogenum]